jgi:hypothetical protein
MEFICWAEFICWGGELFSDLAGSIMTFEVNSRMAGSLVRGERFGMKMLELDLGLLRALG